MLVAIKAFVGRGRSPLHDPKALLLADAPALAIVDAESPRNHHCEAFRLSGGRLL